MRKRHHDWTNQSVLRMAGNIDPVEKITELSRALVLNAIQLGWMGPPFDPFELAEIRRLPFVPREDIKDARTVPTGSDKVRIEFNPNRPLHRIRYSLAHEIAHTLFPDAAQRVWNRLGHEDMTGDDWQLETLCNIAAGEILMPISSFPELKEEDLTINNLLRLGEQFHVSLEALFLRAVKLTDQQCIFFCASKRDGKSINPGSYHIDYSVPSKTFSGRLPSGTLVPTDSKLGECTAIGFTSMGIEEWPSLQKKYRIECIGISPYPGHLYPRVIGLLKPYKKEHARLKKITYLTGDATQPRGKGVRLITHVVNDKATTWGAGFAKVVRNLWPHVQQDFKKWAFENRSSFSLGCIHLTEIDQTLRIVHMIGQHGYGRSQTPGIRYEALRGCLEQLEQVAKQQGATIHMPRIGCGEAQGRWDVVEELIDQTLCSKGLEVTVYDLPGSPSRIKPPPLDRSVVKSA